ncbi:hypothetical protein ACFOEK_12140 [Litoribrevibacter euphylliae]|uniref:Uncharacterized protein n=1 Tax=Litoribrevibacter euphylliae TaxID=1834034 RepID=A0ABV7HH88_9GAMM
MDTVAAQEISSEGNTALHGTDSGSYRRPQYATVCKKEAHLWNDLLSPYEKAGLLHRAGLDETGYMGKWEHFNKEAHAKIRTAIKKVATWQLIAGIR